MEDKRYNQKLISDLLDQNAEKSKEISCHREEVKLLSFHLLLVVIDVAISQPKTIDRNGT